VNSGMVLGLKHNNNLLVDYDPEWPVEFARERERLSGGHRRVPLPGPLLSS
jgi:GrpB-like predicted nucleotidyltransferase (UPF0157 family)